ncbi:helix-turn-helix domain-containing protein [Pseudokordiimonas caeni]|uniref:helix-turn-helix domain-containing protein n=1 Tax=Pseudokordiimonas caeni TaxID=2997908 RepID=UPI0028119BC0|nr:short-chain fatty acyl-CoA regulator family protein [Pseudokordiimonas caeni]
MAEAAQKKIFAGPRIRRLRRELGLSQAQMSAALGFSTSYLNLVERNQRPVSAQFLLRLAEVYDVELATFAGTDEARAFADLTEIMADPMFKPLGLTRGDMQDMADAAPKGIEAFNLLYSALRQARQAASDLSNQVVDRTGTATETVVPVDEVRDWLHDRRNYFPELDEAAESLHTELGLDRDDPFLLLSARLDEEHGVRVRIMPHEVMPETLRHFDFHRRQLQLSELLDRPARQFQIAFQLALLEQRPLIQRLSEVPTFQTDEAHRVLRISLANYFAAALIMPYGRFLKDARALKYDVEHLGRRYGCSFEQVCHRLTTLQKPGERGIPFFLVRVDKAGNVSKRYSAGRFHFTRFGGTCPLWSVHDTFTTPGRIVTQIIEMPDRTTYFTVSRTVRRVGAIFGAPDQQVAIGLGCDIGHARELIYAKGHDLENIDATPVGPDCRLCERPNCPQRAHPPLTRALILDERSRGISSYRFSSE